MDYLKMPFEWLESTETLSDAEFRRLIISAVQYCRDEREPSLQGGERHVWTTLKRDIDRDKSISKKRSQAGKCGGRPKTSESNEKQNGILLLEEKESPLSPSSSPPTPPVITPPIAPQKKKKTPIAPAEHLGVFANYANGNLELLDALNGYDEMRANIKKPMTDRARKMLCNRLDRMTCDTGCKVELLDEAVFRCWQSVYPPDDWHGERRREDGRGTTGNTDTTFSARKNGGRWGLESDL